MARSLWKGAISFGLVNVPVELFPAEERKEFQFSMLDKRDLSPVGYKRYEDLMRRIKEKIKSGETEEIARPEGEEAEKPRSAQIIDLAALLKQSLAKGGPRKKAGDGRRSKSGRPPLRVVSSRGSAKAPAKRKRA